MPIKLIVQLLSYALIGIPILAILYYWNQFPDRLPLHFDKYGQADRFGTRQQWMSNLFWSLFWLSLIRTFVLYYINHQEKLRGKQRVILYLLTSGFITGASLLLIGEGILSLSLYREWMPVLFFLTGGIVVYYVVPANLPTPPKKMDQFNSSLAQQLANRQHIHTQSRLLTIRINLLAVLVMLFVNAQDRWSVGILANILVCIYLAGLSIYLRQNTT